MADNQGEEAHPDLNCSEDTPSNDPTHSTADVATSPSLPRGVQPSPSLNAADGLQQSLPAAENGDDSGPLKYEQEPNPTSDELASQEEQGLLNKTPDSGNPPEMSAAEMREWETHGLRVGWTSLIYSLTVLCVCLTGAIALDSSTLLATALEAAADAVGDSLVVWRFSTTESDSSSNKERYDEMVCWHYWDMI